MRARSAFSASVVTFLSISLSSEAVAQVRASEFATVSQVIDGTEIAVEYSRPRLRGRDPIFGGPVYWGEVWTPGANWATTVEFSKDVSVNDHEVTAGKYSLWMVVQPEVWTVVFEPDARLFHVNRPSESDDQVRFDVTPAEGPLTEALTFTFTHLSPTGATLALNWGTTYVPLDIKVPSSRELTVSDEIAGRLVGSYTFTWSEQMAAQFETPRVVDYDIMYEDGSLHFRWTPAPFPEWEEMLLIPITDEWFNPASRMNGEIFDLVDDVVMEFNIVDGVATSFDVRAPNDDIMATGVRK